MSEKNVTLDGMTTLPTLSEELIEDQQESLPGIVLVWSPKGVSPNNRADVTKELKVGRSSTCDWKIKDNKFYLKIEVPANSIATVQLPTADSSQTLESGKSLDLIHGIHDIEKFEKKLVLKLGSGTYNFNAPYQ